MTVLGEHIWNQNTTQNISQVGFSDVDLARSIQTTALVLSYCRGRGSSFDLASNALERDLSMLTEFAFNRGWCNSRVSKLKE